LKLVKVNLASFDRYLINHNRNLKGRKIMKTYTPWGDPQHIKIVAPGIVEYSTASHGGMHLSASRLAAMPKQFAGFKPFAGPGWFEEDCDIVVVMLAFPKDFSPVEVKQAKYTYANHIAYYESRGCLKEVV
jgi:hypothetical protein